MSLRPLWPETLLALLYWDTPRIVPYATKLARVGILCSGALILPGLVYASLYGWPTWSEYTSSSVLSEHHHGPIILVFAGLWFVGTVLGFAMAGICYMIDAKRSPRK